LFSYNLNTINYFLIFFVFLDSWSPYYFSFRSFSFLASSFNACSFASSLNFFCNIFCCAFFLILSFLNVYPERTLSTCFLSLTPFFISSLFIILFLLELFFEWLLTVELDSFSDLFSDSQPCCKRIIWIFLKRICFSRFSHCAS